MLTAQQPEKAVNRGGSVVVLEGTNEAVAASVRQFLSLE